MIVVFEARNSNSMIEIEVCVLETSNSSQAGLGPVVDTDTRALGCNNGTLFEAHVGMRLGGANMTELLFEGCPRTSARALPTS